MPWRGMSLMEQRLQLVTDYRTGFFTVTELAEQYGISRKTVYKWIDRAEEAETMITGLIERSRRPHHSPHATDPALITRLVAVRKRHPRWGARKLLGVTQRADPDRAWPKRSTVCEALKREGLITPRARARRLGHPPSVLVPITAPNGTWTTDFKVSFAPAIGGTATR